MALDPKKKSAEAPTNHCVYFGRLATSNQWARDKGGCISAAPIIESEATRQPDTEGPAKTAGRQIIKPNPRKAKTTAAPKDYVF